MKEPFFIIGSGRCGSTLLRRILMAHPEVYIPSEVHHLGNAAEAFMKAGQTPGIWREKVEFVVDQLTRDDYYDDLFSVKRDELRQEFEKLRPCSNQELFSYFYIMQMKRDKPGATRWGDKTPCLTSRLREVEYIFPCAYWIHLLRDGIDVTASWLERDKYRFNPIEGAKRWKVAVTLARAHMIRNPLTSIEIRYEDLIREPERIIKQVCQFIDLRFEPEMINDLSQTDSMLDVQRYDHLRRAAQPIDSKSIGKGYNMPEDDLKRVREYLKPELKWCGYE